jgi:hypothetical protein
MELTRERLKELYPPPTTGFTFVDVPDLPFVMTDGASVPDGEEHRHPTLGEAPATLRLDRLDKGRCVQIMHVGDYRNEAATVARRLHAEFLPAHGLVPHGHHHEVYLSDPDRVAPEKMRTVVRQPVRPRGRSRRRLTRRPPPPGSSRRRPSSRRTPRPD